ncbi:MAG: glycosyltransferase [Planctomycetes bacterium]|nr:glycosyltransferase [Planctomycetota bacterium]
MRLAVVTGWLDTRAAGGSARFALELAKALAARGHQVRALVSAAGVPEVPPAGVSVEVYPVSRPSGPRFWLDSAREVRRRLGGADVDLVHTHHLASARGALGATRPRVHTCHMPWHLEYRQRGGGAVGATLLENLERPILARASAVAVLSRYVADLLPGGLSAARVIPPGVDLDRFRPWPPRRSEARSALGWPEEGPLVVTARRLEPRMGVALLLEALARMDRGVRAVVVGEGGERARLEARSRGLGLVGRVLFTGHLGEDRLPLALRAADAFAVPSLALEGFGMATLEALACETPVAGTAVGATPEVLAPLDPACVAPRADPADLAAALGAALEAGPGARAACRSLVEGRYRWDQCAAGYESLFEEALARTPS